MRRLAVALQSLHGFCAGRHLSAEIVRVLVDGEDRAEVEEETQTPCDRTDQKNGGLQTKRICDDAGNDRSRNRAEVLDEIFHCLRR